MLLQQQVILSFFLPAVSLHLSFLFKEERRKGREGVSCVDSRAHGRRS
jgi:hypothetical protein